MKTLEWLNKIDEGGSICDRYRAQIPSLNSKKQLYEFACDINAASFLCETEHDSLPYDVILSEFDRYINGACITTQVSNKGDEYTSTIYCCYEGDVNIDTTVATFLGCKGELFINDYHYALIFIDKGCDIKLNCSEKGKAIVTIFGDAKVEFVENNKNIKVKRK